MFVHGTFAVAECHTWLSLYVCYFHTKKDGVASCSHSQAYTMDGIILGSNCNSNATIVYNPHNYYSKLYQTNPHRQPGSIYFNIKNSNRLFCNLYQCNRLNQDKAYPPGTRVEQADPLTQVL